MLILAKIAFYVCAIGLVGALAVRALARQALRPSQSA